MSSRLEARRPTEHHRSGEAQVVGSLPGPEREEMADGYRAEGVEALHRR